MDILECSVVSLDIDSPFPEVDLLLFASSVCVE